MPCEVCGVIDKTERHHINYSQARNVIFLCKKHHFELHSWDSVSNKKIGKEDIYVEG
jgi:hypothetical protein